MHGSEESKFLNSTEVSYLDTSKIRREELVITTPIVSGHLSKIAQNSF